MARDSAWLTVLLVGCGGSETPIDPATLPWPVCTATSDAGAALASGSSTLAATDEAIYAVNVEEGTLSRYDLRARTVDTLAVGGEPTRIAVANGALFVSLRTERAVAVVDLASFTETGRLQTGNEPVGVVASPDGSRVYVAASQSGTVEAWDVDTLTRSASYPVPGEPRWLAVHPDGGWVYVASAFGSAWHAIELESGRIEAIPYKERALGVTRVRHATGDPAVSPDGSRVAIPTVAADQSIHERRVSDAFFSSALSLPVVAVTHVVGGPPGRHADFAVGDTLPGGDDAPGYVASYVSSVTASPDGCAWALTMEGSAAVLFTAASPDPDAGAWHLRPSAVARVPGGPRGVAYVSPTTAFAHAFLDRALAPLDADVLAQMAVDEANGLAAWPLGTEAGPAVPLAVPALAPEIEEGRRLFYTAVDGTPGGARGGVSCATCHPEGRTDGLAYSLYEGLRSTPSLAGGVEDTTPLTWTGQIATTAEVVTLMHTDRMGGAELTSGQTAAVAAYIEQLRLPDLPDIDPGAVARGAALAESVGCTTCHAGPSYTDQQMHPAGWVDAIDTPTLRGVAATAPYLIDGSAPTLEAVIARAADGYMGQPFEIDEAQTADLVAWLRSL